MMSNASFLRNGIKQMMVDGQPRFHILDAGDSGCLPVVTAMLNPELNLPFDSIDLQHAPAALVYFKLLYGIHASRDGSDLSFGRGESNGQIDFMAWISSWSPDSSCE
jgi:hypothetical protein